MKKLNWKQEVEFCLRIFEFVFKNSQVDAEKRPYRAYETNGLVLKYDKIWFTGDFDVEKHRVMGKDWSVIIAVSKRNRITTNRVDSRVDVTFLGERLHFVGVEYANKDSMERDLSLLRMFGVEEIFWGA